MAAAGVRDWAELLPELLKSISEWLTVVDYLRLGAVCTTWAAAAALSPHDGLKRPPELPFLLHNEIDGEPWTLVGINDRRSRRMTPLPEMQGKWMVGSQDGWLTLIDNTSVPNLFNPLTRVHIPLPSITTIGVKEFVYASQMPFHCLTFKKIVFSSRPTPSGGFTCMAIFCGYNYPAITTHGREKWTFLRGTMTRDIIYREGKFLLVSYTGELWAVDPTVSSPQMTMIVTGFGSSSYVFLVESSHDLLQVWGTTDLENDLAKFKVMRFDPHKAEWVKMKSLGDRSLFLGGSCSISLSAREISELKPNCIYYAEILWDSISVGVFNMEDRSMDHYLPSDRRLGFLPLFWFTPSLL